MTAAPAPNALTRKKLPIGIQTFREVREEGHYYVDKSGITLQLITDNFSGQVH